MLSNTMTDTGNAERFRAVNAGKYLYLCGKGWLAWRGSHWQGDERGSIIEACKATARQFLAAAAQWIDDNGRSPVGAPKNLGECAEAWALKSHNFKPLCAMRDLAATMPEFARIGTEMDGDPWLLATPSATVNLQTGDLRDPDPQDLITACTRADPTKAGSPLRWQEFLDEILPDPALQDYVHRAVGMSLIGKQRDHVVLLCYGTGRNGKGTFFRALESALGDYYATWPAENLVEREHPPHATSIAALAGKRMVVTSEVSKSRKIDEAKLKELTGGDTIKARFMRQDEFEFTPAHTLWICANTKPRISGTDDGIWRRVRLIPFETKIPRESQDPTLDDTFAANRNAILKWALAGAADYVRFGLGTCAAVDAATDAYRQEEDLFGAMLADICDVGSTLQTPKDDFRRAVGRWYEDRSYHAPNDRAIAAEMANRGISATTQHPRQWIGIGLKAPAPSAAYAKTYHDKQEA